MSLGIGSWAMISLLTLPSHMLQDGREHHGKDDPKREHRDSSFWFPFCEPSCSKKPKIWGCLHPRGSDEAALGCGESLCFLDAADRLRKREAAVEVFEGHSLGGCRGWPSQVGVSQNQGYPFGGPHSKDYSILGSTLGSPYFGKLPSELL